MTTVLERLAPPSLPDRWEKVRGLVASACARSGGKYAAVDVLRLALGGAMQLWAAMDGDAAKAVAITEVTAFPRRLVCRVLACTGEGPESWLGHLAAIETWARAQGCTAIEPVARPGWERLLKPLGYRKTHVILEKPL